MKTLMRAVSVVIIIFMVISQTACDNKSTAQPSSEQLDATFSGSFVTGTVNSDTNMDGRPSFNRIYEGASNLGELTIFIVDEFAVPIPPVICPEDNLEFLLVSGSFVFRTPDGDLLLGELESAISCFDPETRTSVINYIGEFTKGTGEFENISGELEITINSDFLNLTSENGFASGGSTGSISGTIDFP
jgi:hypothetical protein